MINRSTLVAILISLVTFVIIVCAYWSGLHGPFFLDDLQTIAPTKMSEFSWRSLIEISVQNDTGPLGRPVSVATFALNNYLFGDSPFAYKIVNLGLHLLMGIAVGLFVYLLIRLLPKNKSQALLIAGLTALLWLIHPLHVSTVLYPVQRMTQLCHLFILMGLNTYLYGRIRLLTQKPYAKSLIALSFVFFPLSILSKETGVLFIWYLFIVEYFILKFNAPKPTQRKIIHKAHCIMSTALVIAALCYYWAHLPKYLTMYAEKNISMLDRLLTQLKVLLFYGELILFPQISRMGLYHDDFPISHSFDCAVALSSVILLALGFAIYYFRKRAPVVSFGLSWFFISQTIESTILPLELVFEHRNYLASVGLLLIPSYYFIIWFKKSKKNKPLFGSLLTCLIALLLVVTYQRSDTWSNAGRFLASELYYHPNSARVHIELANLFLTNKWYDQAFAELDTAQRLQPYNAGITLHKILIYCHSKNVPDKLYEEARIKVKQGPITPYVIMVLDQMVQNIFNQSCDSIDKTKIKEIIQQALNNPFLWYKPLYSAVLYHLEGGIVLLEHNVNQSRYLLNKSYEVYPNRLDPLIQKAYLEMQHGMMNEAQATIKTINANACSFNTSSDKVARLMRTMNEIKSNGNHYQ